MNRCTIVLLCFLSLDCGALPTITEELDGYQNRLEKTNHEIEENAQQLSLLEEELKQLAENSPRWETVRIRVKRIRSKWEGLAWQKEQMIARMEQIENTATGCYEGNCNNGFGVYRFRNGQVYNGHFSGSGKHGLGTIHFPEGGSVWGEWRRGELNGFCKETPPEGPARFRNCVWKNGKIETTDPVFPESEVSKPQKAKQAKASKDVRPAPVSLFVRILPLLAGLVSWVVLAFLYEHWKEKQERRERQKRSAAIEQRINEVRFEQALSNTPPRRSPPQQERNEAMFDPLFSPITGYAHTGRVPPELA